MKGVEMVLGFATTSSSEKLKKYIDAVEDINNPMNHGKNRKVINWVQCMGIEKIGFQAQPFDARVLENIKKIKEMYPSILVSVDGGVNLNTAAQLVEAGADRLVVGSALFTSDSISDTLVKISNTFNA
jgi:pentose-5-phosphate-3-epimerase